LAEADAPGAEAANAPLPTPAPVVLGFPLLEDAGHRTIDRFGLLNPAGRGWPHPATYVVDRDGVVRWKFVNVDYRVRATNEMVLGALEQLR
jgi:peroxiredoxin